MFLDPKETKQLSKLAHVVRLMTFVLELPSYNLDHGSVYVSLFLSSLSSYWTLSRGSAMQF
jgi:hypothetical protein